MTSLTCFTIALNKISNIYRGIKNIVLSAQSILSAAYNLVLMLIMVYNFILQLICVYETFLLKITQKLESPF